MLRGSLLERSVFGNKGKLREVGPRFRSHPTGLGLGWPEHRGMIEPVGLDGKSNFETTLATWVPHGFFPVHDALTYLQPCHRTMT